MASEPKVLGQVEVSFDPSYSEWPHFIAVSGDPAGVEILYELGEEGWRATMIAGGPGGYEIGDFYVPPLVEDALWRASAALTGTPDAEAVSAPILSRPMLPPANPGGQD